MTVLNPDNKPTSLRVDALGRLRVTGTTGGGGGGEGGPMTVQAINASRALTAADNNSYIRVEADDVQLAVPDTLPENFFVTIVPFNETTSLLPTGDATISGGDLSYPFPAESAGYEMYLRRMTADVGYGANYFEISGPWSTIQEGYVNYLIGNEITNQVPPLIMTERTDYVQPQIDSRQQRLGNLSFAASGLLASYMNGNLLETGSGTVMTIPSGMFQSSVFFALTQPGATFDLTADTGVKLNGVLEDTITFDHATSKIIMIGQYADSIDAPNDWWAYAIA